MTWRIQELEAAVRKKHGEEHADSLHAPLQSFAWKTDMARYHAGTAEDLLRKAMQDSKVVGDDDPENIAAAKATFLAASPDPRGAPIRIAKFEAEAHMIASAQALHSLCDILAQIVYWSYALDTQPRPPNPERLNLYSVAKAMLHSPQLSETRLLLEKVVASSEFQYLNAFVNTTKHASLVEAQLSASIEEGRGGLRLRAFVYTRNGVPSSFAAKWASDFLAQDNYEVLIALVKAGHSLNDYYTMMHA